MNDRKKLANVLVAPDNPEFLEGEIVPSMDMFDLASVNVKSIRDVYREKQRGFQTAPFDTPGSNLKFFPGGFTIWSGEPGHGKTATLRQLVCKLLYANRPTFVCSLEEKPIDYFLRLCCTALGTDNPSEDGLQWCVDTWLETLKIWNYTARESDCEHAKILAAIRVLARDFNVRDAIIDNYMCLDVPSNDLEKQRQFAQKLIMTCESADSHVHLVAHPRKKQRADAEYGQDDVAGSSDLVRKADNIIFTRRTKNEREVSSPDAAPSSHEVMKQRHGSGRTWLAVGWFNRNFKQFTLDQFQQEPTRYLHEEAYKFRIAQDPLY